MLALFTVYGILGAVTGLLAGLLGIGGGVVMVPMLHVAFGLQDISPLVLHKLALGTSLAGIMFTSVSSTLAHQRHVGVQWNIVGCITPGILVGTLLGSFLAARIPAQWLQVVFVIFLLYVIYSMLFGKKPKASRHLPGPLGLSAAGGVIGCVSGLVGIGGGSMSVPYMLWHNVEIHKTIGTSAAIGFPIALSGTLGYVYNGWNMPGLPEYCLGLVYLPGLLILVTISMLTAPLGAKLAHRLPVGKLKKAFAALLTVMCIKLFFDAMAAF